MILKFDIYWTSCHMTVNLDEILGDVEQYLTEKSKTVGQEFAGLRR